MNQYDRSRLRRWGTFTGLSAAAGAALAAALIPAAPAFASPGDDAVGAAADAAAGMKVNEEAVMDKTIEAYFSDLAPHRVAEAEITGLPGGSPDPGDLAVAQENATILDIFGNAASPGAVGFETGITNYYDLLIDLLPGSNEKSLAAATVGAQAASEAVPALTKLNEEAVMDKTIDTYFGDLSAPERLAEAEFMGISGGSPDLGDLAVAQENATIVDIFGSAASPGAVGFETAITNYYDLLIDLLPSSAAF
jgi:hypothetical protein